MNIRNFFIAWVLCSTLGGITKIMHFNYTIATVLLAGTLFSLIGIIYLVLRRLANRF